MDENLPSAFGFLDSNEIPNFSAGFLFSDALRRKFADFAVLQCIKNFTNFNQILQKCLGISMKFLPGLNPSHPDSIIENLFKGNLQISKCFGDRAGEFDVFSVPITYCRNSKIKH